MRTDLMLSVVRGYWESMSFWSLNSQEHVKQVLIFVYATGRSLLLMLQNDGVDDVKEAFPAALDFTGNAADEHREA